METKFGVGEWKTRNGRKAVVLGIVPSNHDYRLLGYSLNADGYGDAALWTEDGMLYSDEASSEDLISPWTSPIAPGHNPDKLTVEQVGEGWWLPEWEVLEKVSPYIKGKHLEFWSNVFSVSGEWKKFYEPTSDDCSKFNTYRTRLSREELLALISPKKRLIRVEELPPVCWVSIGDGCGDWLVTQRKGSRIGHSTEIYTIDELHRRGRKWSSDLKTWNSFEVEDKQ